MKQLIFVFLVMAASAVLNGQTPVPFNPFGSSHPYGYTPTPTPRPTVSKKALSQVPSQTQDAKTNRNSSTAILTPTPRPNNRTMPPENSAPVANGSISFGNGAQLVRQGDQVIITYGGRRYVMSRKDAKPPPAEMKLTSCGVAKHYLDTQQRVTDRWRAVSLWWADHCLN